jgi:hypothetical protein
MAFKIDSTTVLGDNYSFTADKQYLSSPAGFIQIGGFQGLVAGFHAGGTPSGSYTTNIINRFPFSTPFTTASTVGNLSTVRRWLSAQSSDSSGFSSGGETYGEYIPVLRNTIDKFPFSTPFTTASNVGNLTSPQERGTGNSSSTDGYHSGAGGNTINKFPFSTPFTTATNAGNLSTPKANASGQSSDMYGHTSGGSYINIIDRFPFSTPFTTATDIGDLSQSRGFLAGQSSQTDGYGSGGSTGSYTPTTRIDRFPFSTPFTTATNVGSLSQSRNGVTGHSSLDFGYTSGGRLSGSYGAITNTIDKFPFSTPFTTAADAGDLSTVRYYGAGHQY